MFNKVFFFKKKIGLINSCHIEFEQDSLSNYENKMKCADKNPSYLLCESQYMTMYSYPTDVVFAGDSITYRCQWNEMFPELSTKNRGLPSDTTEGMLARLDSIIKTKPDKVFIMIGINDISLQVEERTILDNYSYILDAMAAHTDIKIYVQSILPVAPNSGISKEEILRINHAIQEVCMEKGIEYIDLYDLFSDDSGWLKGQYNGDGVHINAKGYECWRNSIETYVY
jgi:lysophospholipase L1-like esterase